MRTLPRTEEDQASPRQMRMRHKTADQSNSRSRRPACGSTERCTQGQDIRDSETSLPEWHYRHGRSEEASRSARGKRGSRPRAWLYLQRRRIMQLLYGTLHPKARPRRQLDEWSILVTRTWQSALNITHDTPLRRRPPVAGSCHNADSHTKRLS